jgi:hypothetical protein
MTLGNRREPRRWTLAGWLAFIAVSASYLTLFLRSLWRIGDEGSIVHGAERVTQGALPYRDFFEVMGPGAFYWLALWFKLLGATWVTSRLEILVMALASGWAILALSTKVIQGRLTILPATLYTIMSVPFWPGANHHFESNTWALLGLVAFATQRGSHRGWTIASGLFAGAAATVIPQKGLLVLIAMLLATWLEHRETKRWRHAAATAGLLLVPFAAVGLSVIAFYALHGALQDLVYAMAIWPATRYHAVNLVPYGYGAFELLIAGWGSSLNTALPQPVAVTATAVLTLPFLWIAALPFAYVAAATGSLWDHRRVSPAEAASIPPLYWCAAPALFIAEIHRPDINHLIYGSPLLLIVTTAWLSRQRRIGAPLLRLLSACGLALGLFTALLATKPGVVIQTRAGEVRRLERDEALEFLQAHVKPGEAVFVYPYYPMYYFLAKVRNPTRYSILMYHINTREQFEEAIASLETERVEYVLVDTVVAGENLRRWFPNFEQLPEEEQILERYLAERYIEIGVKNRYRLLQRRHRPS